MMPKEVIIEKVEGGLWTPVRTKPRAEKKLAEFCAAKKINCYLPLRKTVHRYQRRTAEFFVPMFPGYVFCWLNYELSKEIIMCKAFFHKIKIDELSEKTLIEELKSIQILEKSEACKELIVRPELVQGVNVKISKGPFAGMNGIVEKRKDCATITINIEILGQSVTAQMDIEDVEAEE